jgi:hypothetical protein
MMLDVTATGKGVTELYKKIVTERQQAEGNDRQAAE